MLKEGVVPGLRSVGSVLSAILVVEWLALALALQTGTRFPLIALLRAAVMVVLCWHAIQGRFWARVSLAGLLMFVGAAALLSGVGVLSLEDGLAPETMILGTLDVAGALALFLVPPVRAYFDSFRRGY